MTWRKVKTNLRENLNAVVFFDKLRGYAVGASGSILRTDDGGETWIDQESPVKMNLYAMTAYRRDVAIVVGEFGTVLRTQDGGKTWEIQPNITSNSLQAVAYRGGTQLWIGGRGGAILRRSETLSTVKTVSAPKLPPFLRSNSNKPKLKQPIITIVDDDDIPSARPPKKDKPQ